MEGRALEMGRAGFWNVMLGRVVGAGAGKMFWSEVIRAAGAVCIGGREGPGEGDATGTLTWGHVLRSWLCTLMGGPGRVRSRAKGASRPKMKPETA